MARLAWRAASRGPWASTRWCAAMAGWSCWTISARPRCNRATCLKSTRRAAAASGSQTKNSDKNGCLRASIKRKQLPNQESLASAGAADALGWLRLGGTSSPICRARNSAARIKKMDMIRPLNAPNTALRSGSSARRGDDGGGGHTLEERGQAQQAGGAQQGQPGARQHQQGHDDFKPERQHGGGSGSGFGHSITSPRSRNLAMAMLPTKLNSASSSAASK